LTDHPRNLLAAGRVLPAVLAVLALAVFASCGSDSSNTATPAATGTPVAGLPPECAQDYVFTPIQGIVPIIVPQEITVGQSRFAFALQNGAVLVNNAEVSVRLEPCAAGVTAIELATPWRGLHTKEQDHSHDPGQPEETSEVTGIYAADVSFTAPGRWIAQFNIANPAQTPRVFFDVRVEGTTPAIGAAAPSVDTPVATPGANLKAITSANPPRPELLSVSLKDALTQGKPIMLIIATPAFCRSRICGPVYEEMVSLYDRYKDRVTFIQVEPYVLDDTGQPSVDPATNDWKITPIVTAFGLPGEPWTFVIDASGKVAAKFEGMVNADEAAAALDKTVSRY
jgi:hypothetical protein